MKVLRLRFLLLIVVTPLIFISLCKAAVKKAITVTADTIKPSGKGTKTTFTKSAEIKGNLTTTGNTTGSGTLTVAKAAALKNTLSVAGATKLNGGLAMETNKFVIKKGTGDTSVAGTLTVAGATKLNGGLTMDTNKFVVADGTGNTALAGTLGVDGAAIFNGNVTIADGQILYANEINPLEGTATTSFSGNVYIPSERALIIGGDVTIGGTVHVDGPATFNMFLDVKQGTTLEGTLDVYKNTMLNQALEVVGLATLNDISVGGVANFSDDILLAEGKMLIGDVKGNADTTTRANDADTAFTATYAARATNATHALWADVAASANSATNFNVSGTLNTTGLAMLHGGAIIGNGTDLCITGSSRLLGQLSVNQDKFIVDALGNITSAGMLEVAGSANFGTVTSVGAATINSLDVTCGTTIRKTLSVADAATFNRTLDVKQSTTLEGTLDVHKNVLFNRSLSVGGPTILSSLSTSGDASIDGTLDIAGVTTMSTLNTLGSATVNSLGVTTNGIIGGDLTVSNSVYINGKIDMNGKFTVMPISGDTAIAGTLAVSEVATMNGGVVIANGQSLYVNEINPLADTTTTSFSGNVFIQGNKNLTINGGDTSIGGALEVIGEAALNNSLDVQQSTTLEGTLDVYKDALLNRSLNVAGQTTLSSLSMSGNATVGGTLNVSGSTQLNGGLIVDVDKFIVADGTGNTTIAGTFDVTDVTTLNNTLDVKQSATLESTLDVYKNVLFNEALTVLGLTTLNNKLDVKLSTTLESTLDVYKNAIIREALNVLGLTTLSNLLISGDATFNGKVTIKPLTPLTAISSSVTGAYSRSVAFSPQGDFIAVIDDETLKIFSVDTLGNISSSYVGSAAAGRYDHLTWAPDWSLVSGGFLAMVSYSGYQDNYIQIFSVDGLGNPSISAVSSILAVSSIRVSVDWAPNWTTSSGGFVAITSGSTVKILNVNSSGIISSEISSKAISSTGIKVKWSPNWSPSTGGFVAVMSGNTVIQIFSVDVAGNLSSVISSQPAGYDCRDLAWSPQGDFIATVSYNSTLQIFGVDILGNLSSCISSQPLRSPSLKITWSPHWSLLLGGFVAISESQTNTIQIFSVDTAGNLSSGEVGYAITGNGPNVIDWSPSGDFVGVLCSGSNIIQTFNATVF